MGYAHSQFINATKYTMAGMKLHFLPFLFRQNQLHLFSLARLCVLFLIPLLLVSCTRAQTQTQQPQPEPETITFSLVTDGLSQPVDITHAGDARLFIVEKGGKIRLFENNTLRAEAVLDLSDIVSTNSERGLLSLAFDPNFTENNYFFVYYTDSQGSSTISRFTLNNQTSVADASSEKILLKFSQPFANHNGGQIAFGPDGYLYIASGDGGSGNDPLNAGQNLKTLLGKILRIDVVGTEAQAYSIPKDNPFVDNDSALPEIWAYGLRNPWRFSFDSLTGDMYIADVGQNAFEEVNFQAADSTGGENYGWRLMEARSCFNPSESCNPDNNLVEPILHYAHGSENGRSITGGFVYRGESINSLQRKYIYGDFVSGRIWQAEADPEGVRGWRNSLIEDTNYSISTFGVDHEGELYVASFSGGIYKFAKE